MDLSKNGICEGAKIVPISPTSIGMLFQLTGRPNSMLQSTGKKNILRDTPPWLGNIGLDTLKKSWRKIASITRSEKGALKGSHARYVEKLRRYMHITYLTSLKIGTTCVGYAEFVTK